MDPLTVAELKARAAELERRIEQLRLDIPGVQQRRAWALRKRYTQQAEDYRTLAEFAEKSL